MMSKLIGSAVLLAAAFAPSLVFAQTSTTGLLNVYVQTINQAGFSYVPGNFTVAISGTNPSPATFPGSNQGTKVSLTPGSYSVTLTNALFGTQPTYSTGCSGTIAAGDTQTCVITTSVGNYFGYPSVSPYPYSYTLPSLSCRTDTPVVALGQSARFTAIGGVGGTYNWSTGSKNFPNVGPVLTTSFEGSGSQAVTVTNASQSATCAITVTTSYYPQPQIPTSPVYNIGAPAYVSPYQPILTSYVNPRFPNTGFAPVTSAQIAFALVLTLGAAIAAYPYARKALTIAVR